MILLRLIKGMVGLGALCIFMIVGSCIMNAAFIVWAGACLYGILEYISLVI
jgi:hypothetical protein